MSTKSLIILGLLLLFTGAALPFLMVIRLLAPSFLLSFLSYILTVTGIIVGLAGIALHLRTRR